MTPGRVVGDRYRSVFAKQSRSPGFLAMYGMSVRGVVLNGDFFWLLSHGENGMQEEGFVRPQVVRITLRLDALWLRATIDEGA